MKSRDVYPPHWIACLVCKSKSGIALRPILSSGEDNECRLTGPRSPVSCSLSGQVGDRSSNSTAFVQSGRLRSILQNRNSGRSGLVFCENRGVSPSGMGSITCFVDSTVWSTSSSPGVLSSMADFRSLQHFSTVYLCGPMCRLVLGTVLL